jgi:AAA+ ATPase superfamily predicted ATPase
MNPIRFNPYIVGNPIKSREMFFGREADFQFVARKIGEGRSNQIVVLCGERRSGKTSILFQILGGRLGEAFLPVLIDMQMLAGIKGDREFFLDILRLGCASLDLPGLDLEHLQALAGGAIIERLFEQFLSTVHEKAPGKTVLFLLDEYELVETKIRDGSLSESAIHYLAGVLESPFRVSFVFTGSTNLEDRKVEVWKSLLGKSVYRKISYLSRNDTFRLISEPLRDSVSYTEEVMEAIYRLTGGQPFYTQVICQNMTDLLIEAGKSDPGPAELERIGAAATLTSIIETCH